MSSWNIFNGLVLYVDVVLSDSGGVNSIIHTSGGSSDGIGASANTKSKLQRQKAGSRKTFKFRKTRKDVSIAINATSSHVPVW